MRYRMIDTVLKQSIEDWYSVVVMWSRDNVSQESRRSCYVFIRYSMENVSLQGKIFNRYMNQRAQNECKTTTWEQDKSFDIEQQPPFGDRK